LAASASSDSYRSIVHSDAHKFALATHLVGTLAARWTKMSINALITIRALLIY
jgi:hypothetical protein